MKTTLSRLFLSVIVTACFATASAQDYWKEFKTLSASKDTTKQLALLKTWENANDKDPQLYIAYFNYYANAARTSVVELGNNPKGKDVLELKDSANNTAAFMYDATLYDPKLAAIGIDYINRGIKLSPTRLDMRFGKVYILGELKDYEGFTNEIIAAIKYGAETKYNWLWNDGEPLKDSKAFLLGTVQKYVSQLYDTGNDKLLDNMKRISEVVLKFEPDHVESLSNVAIVHLLANEYTKALEMLLRAEKVHPKDVIVLNNIAYAYSANGDNKNAIKYYELTIKYGNAKDKEFAEKKIAELKAKK